MTSAPPTLYSFFCVDMKEDKLILSVVEREPQPVDVSNVQLCMIYQMSLN